ncbi:MAG: DUF2183 domain-containing protein [Elusimicrobia bacterium]|nr:DUF2183 domain-containing protein [Elusimicrobiota bacterium]
MTALLALAAAVLLSAVGECSPIKDDEEALFFAGYGVKGASGDWSAEVHAWVFEPERDSRKREVLLDQFARSLGLDPSTATDATFRERAAAFLVDNESRKAVAVRVAGQLHRVGTTGGDGHVRSRVTIPSGLAGAGWVEYREEPPPGRSPRFSGRLQLLEDAGLLVISDIDDTIKVSEVRDRQALLANTFLRAFSPVTGMSDAYQAWARAGAAFHYVSASPWQLYPALTEFLRASRFPDGSMHMKQFRWKDRTFFSLFGGQEGYKRGAIEPLLRALPHRRVVLVGDSGEQDPEIFGGLARAFPAQVAAVYIRDVTGEPRESARYAAAFQGVAADRWAVFARAEELPRTLR